MGPAYPGKRVFSRRHWCRRMAGALSLPFWGPLAKPLLQRAEAQVLPSVNPSYTVDSIANSAAGVTDLFSPNSFVSIYGGNLSFVTRTLSAADIRAGQLPTVLLGSGVRGLANSLLTNIYYVSPEQVNVLLPPSLTPGRVRFQLVNDGRAGPLVELNLREASPALFQQAALWENDPLVIATHGLGGVVTLEEPAAIGELVVLYGSGFGPTTPPAQANEIPVGAAWVRDFERFEVWLDEIPADRQYVSYAGVTPYFGGLYQVNFVIPPGTGEHPEVRVGYRDPLEPGADAMMSPPGRRLAVNP